MFLGKQNKRRVGEEDWQAAGTGGY